MQIQEFVLACVERSGGAAERRGEGLFDVLLPAELEAALGHGLIALATDPAVLTAEPRAQLATPGSPFADELIAWAAQRGTVARARLECGKPRRKGMREEVERALTFVNCRVRYEASEPEVLDAHYLQFNFRVTYLSDEKRERLQVIPVNLCSNRASLELVDRLEQTALREIAGEAGPAAPVVSGERAYLTAQRALRSCVAEEAGQHRVRIEKRFGIEFARVGEYYDQVIADLDRRRRGDSPRDSPRDSPEVEPKLRAAGAERESKLRELGEKYRLRTRARLVSARTLVQSKTFFTLLLDRGPATRRLRLCHDPLLDRLELPACEACEEATARVHVDNEARMLCPGCAGRG